MWELSLYFSRDLLCYFNNLQTKLKQMFKDKKNVVSISICENGYVFLLALENTTYKKYILTIKEAIAEIILCYYKPKTIIDFIDNINIKNQDDIILIDILTSFDFYENKAEIVKNLSLINKLYLDSFVYFRLQKLLLDWKETAELVNENPIFMRDRSIKKELMKFLMEGISSKYEKIDIKKDTAEIFLKSNNSVLSSKPMFYSQNNYDNILFTIINNYPKNIEVEDYKNFDVNFIQNLYDLFGNRLTLS